MSDHPWTFLVTIVNFLLIGLYLCLSVAGMVFYYQNGANTYANMGVFTFEETQVPTDTTYSEMMPNPIFPCLAMFSSCKPENRACVRAAFSKLPADFMTDYVPDLLVPAMQGVVLKQAISSTFSVLQFDQCMRMQTVWYVSTESFRSGEFLGSYNYKAMLITAMAIMTAFYAFTFPFQWIVHRGGGFADDADQQQYDGFYEQNQRPPNTVTWLGTGGLLQSVFGFMLTTATAGTIYFTSLVPTPKVAVMPAASSSALCFIACALAAVYFVFDIVTNQPSDTNALYKLSARKPAKPVIRVSLAGPALRKPSVAKLYARLPARRLGHTFPRVINNDKVSELDHMQFANMALQISACLCEPLVWVSVLGNLMFLDNAVMRVMFALVFFANGVKLFIHYDIAESRSQEEVDHREQVTAELTPAQAQSFHKVYQHARVLVMLSYIVFWVTADVALWWVLNADTLVYDQTVKGPLGMVSPAKGNSTAVILLTILYSVDTVYFFLVYILEMSENTLLLARRLWFQVFKPAMYAALLLVAFNTVPRAMVGL